MLLKCYYYLRPFSKLPIINTRYSIARSCIGWGCSTTLVRVHYVFPNSFAGLVHNFWITGNRIRNAINFPILQSVASTGSAAGLPITWIPLKLTTAHLLTWSLQNFEFVYLKVLQVSASTEGFCSKEQCFLFTSLLSWLSQHPVVFCLRPPPQLTEQGPQPPVIHTNLVEGFINFSCMEYSVSEDKKIPLSACVVDVTIFKSIIKKSL